MKKAYITDIFPIKENGKIVEWKCTMFPSEEKLKKCFPSSGYEILDIDGEFEVKDYLHCDERWGKPVPFSEIYTQCLEGGYGAEIHISKRDFYKRT